MNIVTNGYPIAVSKRLIGILEKEISRASINPTDPIYINFRDPDYTAETGGYHPM